MGTVIEPGEIGIGKVVHDVNGRPWVYLGYANRTNLPYAHRFALAYEGNSLANPQWVYDVVYAETMEAKFPDVRS